MTRETDTHIDWPPGASDRPGLPTTQAPPAELEERVVAQLKARGLIGDDTPDNRNRFGWRMTRASLAAAACAAMVAIGVWIGRVTGGGDIGPQAPVLTGAQTDLYALLLFETDDYDAPTATEARTRYSEYSRWVADAVRRGQFVAGEDLEVDHGWVLRPGDEDPVVLPGTATEGGVPLSGIFFVRARDAEHALELAQSLPHLKHGGQVLVQKTIPTDSPPD